MDISTILDDLEYNQFDGKVIWVENPDNWREEIPVIPYDTVIDVIKNLLEKINESED